MLFSYTFHSFIHTIFLCFFQLREAYELSKAQSAMMTIGWITFIPIIAKDKVSPTVMDALREKALVRGKLALVDAVGSLKKYAPQFLVE